MNHSSTSLFYNFSCFVDTWVIHLYSLLSLVFSLYLPIPFLCYLLFGHFQKIVGLSFRRCHLIIFLSIIDLIPFLCTCPYHCILFACRFTFCTPRLFSGSTIILNCFPCWIQHFWHFIHTVDADRTTDALLETLI